MNEFIGYLYGYSVKAILFQDHFWYAPVWLPRSQMKNLTPIKEGEEICIAVKEWLCDKNDIPEFTEVDNSCPVAK